MKKRKGNRFKSARQVGYNLERLCVNFYREQGAFAIRVGSQTKEYQKRAIDVIAYHKGVFYIIQCKRRHDYLRKEEKENLKMAATQFGAIPLLCWRDKGLQFEIIK